MKKYYQDWNWKVAIKYQPCMMFLYPDKGNDYSCTTKKNSNSWKKWAFLKSLKVGGSSKNLYPYWKEMKTRNKTNEFKCPMFKKLWLKDNL